MNPVVRLFALYWIWAAIACQILSFAHAIDPLGMGIAHVVLVPFIWKEVHRARWSFKLHRYLHGLPLLFAILVILLAIGSVLSGIPKQADYLEYRLFRMMRWWEYGRIAFIPDALGGRANYSGTAQECAILPTLVLFKTDRIAMLFSWLAFATLPGLTFQLARLLGTRRRVAWILAWALPPSYAMCVAQAGGGGNDIYGVWFGLLLCILLLRPWGGFEFLPLLAGVAGVFSNVKTSNEILLAVLGLFAIAKFWRLRRSIRPASVALAVLVFLGSSVVPLLAMNQRHYGSIAGTPPTVSVPEEERSAPPSFADFLACNVAGSVRDMVQTPVLPGSASIGHSINRALRLDGPLTRCYGPSGPHGAGFAKMTLLQTEENAGTGCFFALFLLTALAGRRRHRPPRVPASGRLLIPLSVVAGTTFALVAVLSSMGVLFGGVTRIMGPYWYLLGLLFVAWCGTSWSHRHDRRMHAVAALCVLGGGAVAAVIPTRMLVPRSLFVGASSLVSPAMGQRAAETADAYAAHGSEFRGLADNRAIGPVAYGGDYCYMSAYWRLADTYRLSPDWTTPILCRTPDEIFQHDTIVLTSFDLSQWELPDVDTCASENGYRILGHTTALFKRKDGRMNVWLFSRSKTASNPMTTIENESNSTSFAPNEAQSFLSLCSHNRPQKTDHFFELRPTGNDRQFHGFPPVDFTQHTSTFTLLSGKLLAEQTIINDFVSNVFGDARVLPDWVGISGK